jgi:hypothetical protein
MLTFGCFSSDSLRRWPGFGPTLSSLLGFMSGTKLYQASSYIATEYEELAVL